MKIDLVVTYVDNTNEDWQRKHARYCSASLPTFFRTGRNALKYFLRGISQNLPFINQLFLVVQNQSEVPNYVNRDTVRIVTHDKFIPKQYLPTFNSTTIETFLAEIPDLSERFIYINDDIFVLDILKAEDFFGNDMAITYFRKLLFEGERPTFYESIVMNCNELVLEKTRTQIWENGYVICPNHTLRPYFKSLYRECYSRYWDKIVPSLTRFRTPRNYSLYIVDLYQRKIGRELGLMTGRNVFIYNNASEDELKTQLSQNADTICILDHFADIDIFENAIMKEFLDGQFPTVSKYEK